jgi:RNA polymerase sigma-70 factor (ECF subfamily)
MTLNDAMDRYADGDSEAFSEVYDELAPRLYGYLLRSTRNSATAEDLLQQTLLQMHRARGTYRRGADVFPWAFAIAKRLFIDGERRKRRHEQLPDDYHEESLEPSLCTFARAEDLACAKQLGARVGEHLARLPERLRKAFVLVKIEGLSHEEAAQVLGTTVGAVRVRVHRAFQTFAELAENGPSDESIGQRFAVGKQARRYGLVQAEVHAGLSC